MSQAMRKIVFSFGLITMGESFGKWIRCKAKIPAGSIIAKKMTASKVSMIGMRWTIYIWDESRESRHRLPAQSMKNPKML